MAQITLYHGINDAHEFWQSEDHSLLLMRVHQEEWWTAHRDCKFLFSSRSAQQAARRLDAQLSTEMEWVRKGEKFVLTHIPASTISPIEPSFSSAGLTVGLAEVFHVKHSTHVHDHARRGEKAD